MGALLTAGLMGGTSVNKKVPLHQPERGENESRADYRKRQADSRAAVRKMTGHGLGKGTSIREQLRASQRANGKLRAGAYGRGLRNWCNGKPSKGRV